MNKNVVFTGSAAANMGSVRWLRDRSARGLGYVLLTEEVRSLLPAVDV